MPVDILQKALSAIPKADLALFPTPLHRLPNTEKRLGYDGIYVKRDDLTGLGPGGNKLRSLEFLLGEAIQQKKMGVVVSGPAQSNLCTLTAAASARLGLWCILIHNCAQPKVCRGNLLLNRLLGVESHYIGEVTEEERVAYEENLTDVLTGKGRQPYRIVNGATSGVGALGYVAASLEIHRQNIEQNLGICEIFVPAGNGGMAAGLVFGNALLGSPFKIQVISVEYDVCQLEENLSRVIAAIEDTLHLSMPCSLDRACALTDAYRGEGWGKNTSESESMTLRFARDEGIFIENVYNSKVLVAMEDYVRERKIVGGVCFLHSGGFGSLFSQFSSED
jgi:1-aminocyclopropane-1-carboxylate deaminase/D-cysteine desulfhydrase-like pyridoxal-dependent ACC family enzyme